MILFTFNKGFNFLLCLLFNNINIIFFLSSLVNEITREVKTFIILYHLKKHILFRNKIMFLI